MFTLVYIQGVRKILIHLLMVILHLNISFKIFNTIWKLHEYKEHISKNLTPVFSTSKIFFILDNFICHWLTWERFQGMSWLKSVCIVDSLQQFLHESVFCGWEPPRFQLCWEKHGKLLPEALGLTAKRVAKWNTEEVAFDNSRKVHLGFIRGLLNVFIFMGSYLTMLFFLGCKFCKRAARLQRACCHLQEGGK